MPHFLAPPTHRLTEPSRNQREYCREGGIWYTRCIRNGVMSEWTQSANSLTWFNDRINGGVIEAIPHQPATVADLRGHYLDDISHNQSVITSSTPQAATFSFHPNSSPQPVQHEHMEFPCVTSEFDNKIRFSKLEDGNVKITFLEDGQIDKEITVSHANMNSLFLHMMMN